MTVGFMRNRLPNSLRNTFQEEWIQVLGPEVRPSKQGLAWRGPFSTPRRQSQASASPGRHK